MRLAPWLLVATLTIACTGSEPGEIVRTPDERFENLPDFAFAPQYLEIQGLRIHYLDEGPKDARPVLLLHGEPSWAFLYRKMIPGIVAAGHRAIAPDLVGFGRSDKYVHPDDYTYRMQVEVMKELVERLDLRGVVLFCQDWGGLIGLRVVAEDPDRFAGVIASNTGLPSPATGATPPGVFRIWQLFARWSPIFPASRIVDTGTVADLPDDVRAGYDAPFPTRRYKMGARVMPSLVPTSPDDPAAPANEKAWEVLERFEKPFLTAFSDGDPITRGLEATFQEQIPGAREQPHVTIEGAGHFLQEEKGADLAAIVVEFVGRIGE